VTVSLALLALALVPGVAAAKQTSGGVGDRAFCAPAGLPLEPGQCSIIDGDGVPFDFDASSGPLGENPMGAVRFESSATAESFIELEVTCLQVTVNRASIGGRVTPGSILLPGSGFAFTVLDNAPAPDLISGGTGPPAGPPPPGTPDCGDVFEPTFPVQGDIVVQDATCDKFKEHPNDPAKDKCKDKNKP
jgi:hypothetical protein